MNCNELCDWLLDEVNASLLPVIREQELSGIDFLELREDKIKEIFPMFGQRNNISRLIGKFAIPAATNSAVDGVGSSSSSLAAQSREAEKGYII